MAEFLVVAKNHWKDSWDANKVASLTKEELSEYNARTQIGDILIVKPDGWNWGTKECLPDYIVVKVSGLKYEETKMYERTLIDTKDSKFPILLKRRKYSLPKSLVDNAISLGKSQISLTKANLTVVAKVS